MFIVRSHWSDLKLLASVPPSVVDLHWDTFKYFVVVLCHGDPTSLEHQHWSLHMLQDFIAGVDDGVGQVKSLHLSPGGS